MYKTGNKGSSERVTRLGKGRVKDKKIELEKEGVYLPFPWISVCLLDIF